MEGDVLFAALPLGWMLAFGAAMVMGIGGLMRWFARYMLGELEKRLARIETVSEEVRRIEGELKRLMMELPMQYQRRDDAHPRVRRHQCQARPALRTHDGAENDR